MLEAVRYIFGYSRFAAMVSRMMAPVRQPKIPL